MQLRRHRERWIETDKREIDWDTDNGMRNETVKEIRERQTFEGQKRHSRAKRRNGRRQAARD